MLTQKKLSILVTGGAGYVGSHTAVLLAEAGYDVIILDNLACGQREIVERVLKTTFFVGDIRDRALLDRIFSSHKIEAVIHLAACTDADESFENPAKYYQNNVVGTLTLLDAMIAAAVKKVVFSSTCATYGIPISVPILEGHPQTPISPYGAGKLMVERILSDFETAYGLKSIVFRYFNVAGAHPTGLLGEAHQPETHLIPLALQTALGLRDSVSILGTNYSTWDGTCIRDYIHVSDLAQAHVLALEYAIAGGASEVFNLSNGEGFSVREVIDIAQQVTGKPIPTVEQGRRPGDLPVLVGQNNRVKEKLGWQPQYSDLHDMIAHAWHWYRRQHLLGAIAQNAA